MEDDDAPGPRPESLMPYDKWTEAALRGVVRDAIGFAAEHGLPGGHHFYLTFRTDRPGVLLPTRLLAQYPQEMTIVLQHQFWDLAAGEDGFSVGLSFGGVPSTLTVPYAALTAFADPYVQYGLRFSAPGPEEAPAEAEGAERPGAEAPDADAPTEAPQVVSLDAFRRRPPAKE